MWGSRVQLLKSSWKDCKRFMPLMCQSGPALQTRAFLSEIKLKADELRAGCSFIIMSIRLQERPCILSPSETAHKKQVLRKI